MPAHPAWFHQLPRILQELRALEVSHLDRRAVEKLFGLRQRRARQLMAGLPGLRVGNAFAVTRQALLDRLETMSTSERFQWETTRRARLSENLDRIRQQLAARRVRIPRTNDSHWLQNLGGSIELRPGELHIRFHDATDLASQLFQLSQTMAHDWHRFAQAVEAPPAPPSAD